MLKVIYQKSSTFEWKIEANWKSLNIFITPEAFTNKVNEPR